MPVERGNPFDVHKPTTDNRNDNAIVTSIAHISITLVNKDGCVGVELYISDNRVLFGKRYFI